MMLSLLSSIAHQLESPDHLAYGEEAQNFGGDDTGSCQLLGAGVSNLMEDVCRSEGVGRRGGVREEIGRVSQCLENRLEV